jgi:hypothetical protein
MLHGRLALLELILKNPADVVSALGPLRIFNLDLKLVGLDAVFHLVTGAEESVVQDGVARICDLLVGTGVGGKRRGG